MSAKSLMTTVGVVALLGFAQVAGAHPGNGLHIHTGFESGAAHPLTGLDHILAMIAIGVCAAQMGGRAIWMLPVTFMSLLLAGGAFAFGGGHVPAVEQGIAASVLVLGLMVASGSKLGLPMTLGLVGLFAIFHGYAHGLEMQAGLGFTEYAIGFVAATAMLHLVGIGLGLTMRRTTGATLSRLAGASIAVCGAVMLFA
ncbi:HupE/UreJ family protein [soil metagenome]